MLKIGMGGGGGWQGSQNNNYPPHQGAPQMGVAPAYHQPQQPQFNNGYNNVSTEFLFIKFNLRRGRES
jgi:hypothetical protein